jgi:hypothetical protein
MGQELRNEEGKIWKEKESGIGGNEWAKNKIACRVWKQTLQA